MEGKLKTRKWQDQNGQDRYTTEIQGDVLQMLDSRNAGESGQSNYKQAGEKPQKSTKPQAQQSQDIYSQEELNSFDDDIPF